MSRALLGRLLRRAPPPRRDIFGPRVAVAPVDRTAIEAALALPHGTPASPALLAAIAAEMHARRAATGTLDGPPSPVASNLQVRKAGLPDWWEAGGNLCLAAPDAQPTEIALGIVPRPARDSIVVLGAGSRVHSLAVIEGPSLVVFGDRTFFNGGGASALGAGTVLVGEDSTATWAPDVTVKNGGIVIVGADNMWAQGVTLATDDGHAVIDAASGRRINAYGARIVVGRHVWLGARTTVAGDCRIGDDCVVGQGSFVKKVDLPAGTLAVGRPARPVRAGVTWSREDAPPR